MHAAWCLAAHQPASSACQSTQTTELVTSIVVLRFAWTPPPLCHSWKEFFSFCSGNGGGIARALRDLTFTHCSFGGLVQRDDRRSISLAVKAAVRCLLLTANAADNKHYSLAKSLSMFETSTQKTDRRHPTPFPNTNEVECMPATSLHDLLCTTEDSMHNTCTLNQLQIAVGRACDVIYSLIRVSSSWPELLAMGVVNSTDRNWHGHIWRQNTPKVFKNSFLYRERKEVRQEENERGRDRERRLKAANLTSLFFLRIYKCASRIQHPTILIRV